MEAREERGQEMAKQMRIVPKGEQWVVPSSSGSGKYLVKLDEEATHCTCPDFEKRGQKCKHIYAVEFTIQRTVTQQITVAATPAGRTATVTETVTETATQTVRAEAGDATQSETRTQTRRKTYKQAWPAYNAAQTNEKRDFLGLLHDLCSRIEEPPRGMGRPSLPLCDMAFATAFKVYSTVSGRRFMSDLTDAHKKGYVTKLPCYNSIFGYLESASLTPVLKSLITESSLPLRALETDFAVDSTCFSTSRFEKWFNVRWGHEVSEHVWMKAHLCCGVKTHIVTAAKVTARDVGDCPEFAPLVNATAQNFTVDEVSADKAYCSIANLNAVRKLGGTAYVPFKEGMTGNGGGDPVWKKMFHYYAFHREAFLDHYHKRSNAESTFSMIKAKFGDALRSKTDTALENEVLCKVLCHNLCVLIQSFYELKIDPALTGSMIRQPAQAVAA